MGRGVGKGQGSGEERAFRTVLNIKAPKILLLYLKMS